MKKSLIATGAASLALAAMPVVGVFAAPYTPANTSGTVTDTLTVNIPASCTIRNANNDGTDGGAGDQSNPAINNYYYVEMTNGELKTNIGASDWDDDRQDAPGASMTPTDTITISCNTASDTTQNPNPAGWVLTAIGATTGASNTVLDGGAAGTIATGLAESGNTSAWAFKVLKGTGDNVNYSSDYFTPSAEVTAPGYHLVPGSELDIATGAGSFAGGFQMYYQVYVSPTQAQGTYTGAVKYTLYNPAV